MGCNLSEITRCCFCIPLRYGLVAWGYITLTINFIFFCDKIVTINELLNKDDKDNSVLYKGGELVMMMADMGLVIVLIVAAHKVAGLLFIPNLGSQILTEMVRYGISKDGTFVPMIIAYNVTILFCLILSMADFVATIVFIVGGHKKNVKLIGGFYMFTIGDFIVTAVLSLFFDGFSIAFTQDESDELNMDMYLVFFECALYIVSLVVKGYFILLLRSEVIKLKSSGQFKFVNNSAEAEAQCTMLSEENEAVKQTELKDE